MPSFLVRKNCEYFVLVTADNADAAVEKADRLYPNLNDWGQAWSVPEAEEESND